MTDGDDRVWRIGELAQATGLTVRTLHHYDRIGLLSATTRTDGGHRLYSEDDAARLYAIVTLRGLGLRLEQIRDVLMSEVDPRALLAEQLRALTVQLEAGARLQRRLAAILAALGKAERPAAEELLSLVQQTVTAEKAVTEYLTPGQLEHLTRQGASLGEPGVTQLTGALSKLYRQALAEYDAGTAVGHPIVQTIVREIDKVSAALSGGDESVTGGMRRLWAERGEEVYPGAGIPWSALTEYLDRARAQGRGDEAETGAPVSSMEDE